MKESIGLIACPDCGGSDDIILTQKRDEPEMTVVAKIPSPSQVQQNKESVILKKGKFADAKYDSFRRSAEGYNVARELYRNDKNYWYTHQYKKYNWAQYDYNVQKEKYKGEYQDAQDRANKRKEANMKYTYGAIIVIGGVAATPLIVEGAIVGIPYVWNGVVYTGRDVIQGAKIYHNTFGKNGGYTEILNNLYDQSVSQMVSNGNLNVGNYDLISLGTSSLLTRQSSFTKKVLQSNSSTLITYSLNDGLGGSVFKEMSSAEILLKTSTSTISTIKPGVMPVVEKNLPAVINGVTDKIFKQEKD